MLQTNIGPAVIKALLHQQATDIVIESYLTWAEVAGASFSFIILPYMRLNTGSARHP